MAKKPAVSTITSGYNSTTVLNDNFTATRDAFDNTLSLDGSTPNAMTADFDLNSNNILNANSITATGITLNGVAITPTSLAATPAASAVTITDAGGYYTTTEVESALQEVGVITDALADALISTGDTMTGPLIVDTTLSVTGIIDVANTIAHTGDTNTNIAFLTDQVILRTGGTYRLDVTNSGMQLGAANARVTTILDEDDMVSDSATALATQQSIKAYVDNNGWNFSAEVSPTASDTAFDFTGIPAGVKEVTILTDAVYFDSLALFQLGTSAGLHTTNYASGAAGYYANAVTGGSISRTNTGFIAREYTSSRKLTVVGNFYNTGTSDKWVGGGVTSGENGGGSFSGWVDLPGELDRVRVTRTGGGNFTAAGRIYVGWRS